MEGEMFSISIAVMLYGYMDLSKSTECVRTENVCI